MSLNTTNKRIINGIDELLSLEDKSNIYGSGMRREIAIPETTNNRVVIILGDYTEPDRGEWVRSKSGGITEMRGFNIKAPEGTQITVIGGKDISIDCPENDVRFYNSGSIATRYNTGFVHAKNCKDITAHQNNQVTVNGNRNAYTKWNKKVSARGNDELMIFNNDEIDIGEKIEGKIGLGGNKSINPGNHGGIKCVYDYNKPDTHPDGL